MVSVRLRHRPDGGGGGDAAVLRALRLAWCRFRVVLPLLDKTLPSVMAAIDQALRAFGGCPTYGLPDSVPDPAM